MSVSLLSDISIFVLSLLVGFEVISKVPATLHTPLMSAANSIHGIIFVGAMLAASAAHNWLGYTLAFITAAFASANLVGGYAVTDRMLLMFRARKPAPPPVSSEPAPSQPVQAETAPSQTAPSQTAPSQTAVESDP